MLNFNEQDMQKSIVEKVANEILEHNDDLTSMVRTEVRARLDKIFAERAKAQIEDAINEAIQGSFDREYQRVTHFGQAEGVPTTIRKELLKTVDAYWSMRVDKRSGKPTDSSYDSVTRAEYLMTQICAQDFSETMRQSALNVTGALKDGFRNQLAKHMDELLESLFRVKSLQDQGKVEKPY